MLENFALVGRDVLDPALYAKVRAPLDTAETLPPWCYTSEEFYRAEVRNIFLREWNFLGRADRVPQAGDYFTVNFVGVPLIVVRGEDGEVRAFSNTCRHRGSKVAQGEGRCEFFQCPYHGWIYGLDGSLKGAGGMRETKGFQRGQYGLVPVRLESWGGFIFVNFRSDAPPLADFLGDLPAQLASYDCDNLVTTRRVEYDLECNWKLYIENAMEEYHLPHVHGTTLNLLEFIHDIIPTQGNWDAIREEHEGTRALLDEDQEHALPHIPTLEGPPAKGTHYVVIYPSTMLGMTKDTVWWLELHPNGPSRTKLIVGSCFHKGAIARPDFAEKVKYYYKRWDKSIVEDNDVAGLQHEGVSSPFARPGRLSRLEPLVHHIANWVLDRVLEQRRNAA